MTIREAQQAIEKGTIVFRKDEPEKWGILTCLSDDESMAYYKPRGMNGVRCSAKLDELQTDQAA